MMEKITGKIMNLTGRTGLLIKKRSPEILLAVGITGTVASAIMACKATLQVEEVLANCQEKKDKVDTCWEKVQNGEVSEETYSENDKDRDMTVIAGQTAVDFIKLYAPAIALGTASIACIIGGHNIMKKRNVALVAAYKVLSDGFDSYRNRVREKYGEDTDYAFKNGLKEVETTRTVTDEDGKEHEETVKAFDKNGDTNDISIYAKFFDETCSQWSKNAEYNLMFLKAQQNYYNDILKSRGHVFLNEVYDALGIERTKAGAVVGWVLGSGGDDFIDFGIFDNDRPKARNFVNGIERSILLDFNVDGVIYDMI